MIFILGNKIDREEERVIRKSDAEKKMQQLGFDFFEVSAKSSAGIKEFFKHMSERIGGGGKKSSIIVDIAETQKSKGATLVNPNV